MFNAKNNRHVNQDNKKIIDQVGSVTESRWLNDIKVSIQLRNFRIGKGRASGDIDLPLSDSPEFFTSSFKGLLRGSMMRACQVLKFPDDVITTLLGKNVTDPGLEKGGKIKIRFENPEKLMDLNQTQTVKLHGIRIDPEFKSIEHGALFTYEMYFPTTDIVPMILTFVIQPQIPLNNNELSLLIAGLNGLQWESFGGFSSRGGGIIERIDIEPSSAVDIARRQFSNFSKLEKSNN